MLGVSLFVADSVSASSSTERLSEAGLFTNFTDKFNAMNGHTGSIPSDLSKLTPKESDICAFLSEDAASAFTETMKGFHVDETLLIRVRNHFTAEMENGLAGRPSSLAMLPSFVPRLPTGHETGQYLAVDLGGTNLRVMLMITTGAGVPPLIQQRTFKVSTNLMTSNAEELFGYIAAKVEQFCGQYGLNDKNLPLGFTFSYPMDQKSLKRATLIRWTKGFTATGVIDEDVVNLLERELAKRNVNVRVIAILNDTVGTQVATAFEQNGKCDIGIIIGTGTNAAYMEKTNNITKLPVTADYPYDKMIIDTEWGAFAEGSEGEYLLNEFDQIVDATSTHPKEYIFDKLVAGMYLGECARLTLQRLVERGVILESCEVDKNKIFNTKDTFPSKNITSILRDNTPTLENCASILKSCGVVGDVSPVDLLILRHVCHLISERSAAFVAACIASMIQRLSLSRVTVGIDGSLFSEHPHYDEMLNRKLSCLLLPGINVSIVQAGDGSGRGAALVAAVAEQMEL